MVREAKEHAEYLPSVYRKLTKLEELGLGNLTLGEATPAESGGEAQRLKLVSRMNRDQTGTVFVLDDHVIGLGLREDNSGSEIIATGSPSDIANNPDSLTGKYLAHKLE